VSADDRLYWVFNALVAIGLIWMIFDAWDRPDPRHATPVSSVEVL
jgi:hypothetical protein